MELIKITEENGSQVVSARELHSFLEVNTKFTDWCKRMFEYGFEEYLDYSLLKIGKQNAHNKTDYALTIDTAKEISMLQRSEKGKQARQYFIACEKKLRRYALPQNYSEALRQLADKEEEKSRVLLELHQAKESIESNKHKVVFADSVTGSANSILIRDFAKELCDETFKIGQNRLFEWLRENKYLMRNNTPYQNYIEAGYFEVITRTIGSGEETFTTNTTKVTGKGQVYFANKIKNNKQSA